MEKKDKDLRYFAICRNDGGTDWYELYENDYRFIEENMPIRSSRVNYLRKDGSIKFPNKFIKNKDKAYLDVVCSKCEAPMTLIPFSMVDDVAERIRVFHMSDKDRITFAEKYLILEGLEDDNE
jgi:hypothetical protein